MKLTFYGATDTVTGSRFLLETSTTRILVDCGLFQGVKALRERNWEEFPIPLESLDAIVLTHAHIDHSGYIPAVTRTGRFRGKVYCTTATRSLAAVLLPDSGYLQEEQAAYLNRIGASRHTPAMPLYTSEDGENALRYFQAVPFGETLDLGDLQISFRRVAHILGAASVHVSDGYRSISFSGDVGRAVDPLLLSPEPLPNANTYVIESTYGNRLHAHINPKAQLGEVVRRTVERGGALIIPAFAVGRSQMMLYYLAELMAEKAIPRVPIFLDSPMAIAATEIFLNNPDDHSLTEAQCQAMDDIAVYCHTTEESKAITFREGPLIILSASGMATGGRVLHHLKARLGDHRNTILFTGFQAAGTRGEALVNGVDEVKIHGQYHPVKAEVLQMDALSAHADANELIAWLGQNKTPREAYVVHGEPGARDAMRRLLRDKLGWTTYVPSMGDSTEI